MRCDGSCLVNRNAFLFRQHIAHAVPTTTMSKKAGKQTKETASYETREIVLGKVRGYPPWPGMVSTHHRHSRVWLLHSNTYTSLSYRLSIQVLSLLLSSKNAPRQRKLSFTVFASSQLETSASILSIPDHTRLIFELFF